MNLKLTRRCIFSLLLLIFLGHEAYAQNNKPKISGVVTSTDNKPVENISILLLPVRKTTTTDENGKFEFKNLSVGEYTIQILLTSQDKVEKTVKIETATEIENNVSIQLNTSSAQLQEIIVKSVANKITDKSTDFVARMPISNLENPQVYSVIHKEVAQEQLVSTTEGFLKNAPGISNVAIGPGGGGSSVGFVSRGFVTGYTSTRNGLTAGDVTLVDPVNIERMEVIKGPSSTLFGSSVISYGGLVNIVTKQPLQTRKGEFSYIGGSFGYNRLTADYNTPLDSAKNMLFRINVAKEWQQGFQDYGKQNTTDIAPSLLYKVNDRLTLHLDAEFFSTNRPIILYAPWNGAGAANFNDLKMNIKKSFTNEGFNAQQKTSNVFARADYKISDEWTSQTNFTYTNGDYYTPYIFANIETDANMGLRAVREVYDVYGTMNTTDIQQNFIGDFKIGKLRNRLVFGLDYTQFSGRSNRRDVYVDTLAVDYTDIQPLNRDAVNQLLAATGADIYSYTSNIYSAYVSDVLNITPRLLAMGSVRFDHYSPTGDRSQNSVSPKFGLIYQIVQDRVSLFANYMNGFQNTSGQDYNKKAFHPQHANQLEGGVKVELLNKKLNAAVSYYDIEVSNILRNDPDHKDFSIQDGTQESKGLEIDLNANPVNGLNITAGYAYNDIYYKKADEYLVGKRALSAPRNVANLWISYKLGKGALDGFGFGFGGNHSDKSYILADDNSFVLNGYTVMDATVFYDRIKWRVGLKVNNIGDKHYWVANYYPVPQVPRQILGSLTIRF